MNLRNVTGPQAIVAGVVTTVLGGLVIVGLNMSASTEGGTLSVTPEQAFERAWQGLTEAERADACRGVTLYGQDAIAAIMAPELEGTPVDPQHMAELLSEECGQ